MRVSVSEKLQPRRCVGDHALTASPAGKTAVMFMTLWKQRDATLVTVGDALASFLERSDELTRGRCLMAKVDVRKGPLRWRLRNKKMIPNTQPLPVTYYAPLRRRWFAAASITRWCTTMGRECTCTDVHVGHFTDCCLPSHPGLCLVALITGSSLLRAAIHGISSHTSAGTSAFSLGFGAVDSRALMLHGFAQSGSGGLVAAVLSSNLPQAIVSFLYLTYNGLLTSMLLSHEYSKYAVRRKPLRVTTPHGEQRMFCSCHIIHPDGAFALTLAGSTYYLQVRIGVVHRYAETCPNHHASLHDSSRIPTLFRY